MDSIKIPIHSIIDVITNSSTEIFVQASNSSIRIMNDILKSIYPQLKIEDHFNIRIVDSSDGNDEVCGKCEEGCNVCYDERPNESWIKVDFLTEESKEKMDLVNKIINVADTYYRDEYYC